MVILNWVLILTVLSGESVEVQYIPNLAGGHVAKQKQNGWGLHGTADGNLRSSGAICIKQDR